MTQIFLIASFLWNIKTYRSKNLRHLRYLRDNVQGAYRLVEC